MPIKFNWANKYDQTLFWVSVVLAVYAAATWYFWSFKAMIFLGAVVCTTHAISYYRDSVRDVDVHRMKMHQFLSRLFKAAAIGFLISLGTTMLCVAFMSPEISECWGMLAGAVYASSKFTKAHQHAVLHKNFL